jgi:hypothetical protein
MKIWVCINIKDFPQERSENFIFSHNHHRPKKTQQPKKWRKEMLKVTKKNVHHFPYTNNTYNVNFIAKSIEKKVLKLEWWLFDLHI